MLTTINHIKNKYAQYSFNLATKIAIGFAAIGILFVVVVVNNFIGGQQLKNRLQQITEEVNPMVKHATAVNSTVQSIEPLVLGLISSDENAGFESAAVSLSEKVRSLETQLNDISSLPIFEKADKGFKDDTDQLLIDLENSKPLYDDLINMQKEIVFIIEQSNQLALAISEQEKALTPLLGDIYDELDNEILISMVYEANSSLNRGIWIIEKIKHAGNKQQLEASSAELKAWVGNFGSLLPSLIFGSDEEYFQVFVKRLAEIYTAMIKLLEGEEGLLALQLSKLDAQENQARVIDELRILIKHSQHSTTNMLERSFTVSEQVVVNVKDGVTSQNETNIVLGVSVIVGVSLVSLYLINYFRKSIAFILRELSSLASGRIRPLEESTSSDEFGRLNNSLMTVINNLKKIILGINESSTHVNESVQKVARVSTQTMENMGSQKDELEAVVSALGDMKGVASDVAGHTEHTYEKVADAELLSTKGREKVLASKEAVERVVSQTREAIEVITSLDNGVKNIESVMETISNIAEMTNLLALNAAIEAARAGEQGRGFAVVADEVRSLANRTQQATLDIRQKTLAMIEESRQAVDVMHRSEELVAQSLGQTQDADTTIAEFSNVMNQVKDLSHLIATASEKQVSTVANLNLHIEKVSLLSEQTMEQVVEAGTASARQIEITKDLESKVTQFVIEDKKV